MKKTLAILILATLALSLKAEGYKPAVHQTFTNTWTYTNTDKTPLYIEYIDIQALGATTNWTVNLYNGKGITNSLVSQYVTNTFSYYAPVVNRRIEQGGTLTFTCGDPVVTNKVSIYPCSK